MTSVELTHVCPSRGFDHSVTLAMNQVSALTGFLLFDNGKAISLPFRCVIPVVENNQPVTNPGEKMTVHLTCEGFARYQEVAHQLPEPMTWGEANA